MGAPSAETTAAVWKLLGLKIRPEKLRPAMLSHFELTADEDRELETTARQALVVGLDRCIAAARDRRKLDEDNHKPDVGRITFT
ncbi:MAG TPA: hypothetical protein VNC82_12590, partial [Candidatus Limnocylindria bacterium]|nr:hypothetical protein [Candidatus Limnocylindria bacterium]